METLSRPFFSSLGPVFFYVGFIFRPFPHIKQKIGPLTQLSDWLSQQG